MKLFGSQKNNRPETNGPDDVVYAEFANLSPAYKTAPKKELSKEYYFDALGGYKRFPVRALEEATKLLKSLNYYNVKPAKRLELANAIMGHIYPELAIWYKKYSSQDISMPEDKERKTALIGCINVIEQLSIAFKHVFKDSFAISASAYQKQRDLLQQAGFRILELTRLEQRLCALRYQRLPRAAWQNSNQVLFALLLHDDIDETQKLVGGLGLEKKSDKLKNAPQYTSSVKQLYLSIQLFGLLDLSTWPIRLFHVPELYLNNIPDGLRFKEDNQQPLSPGELITCMNSDSPPLFKRRNKMPPPCIKIDYSRFFNTLVRDHEELAKMEFINQFDPSKLKGPVIEVDEEDRIPVLEMILMSLKQRERQQKRHTVFSEEKLRVYFGLKEVNNLMKDLMNPDVTKVLDDRKFVDTLAQQSSLLANDNEQHLNRSWQVVNFSAGGMLIGTEESSFSAPIQIGQIAAVSPHDDIKRQTIGYVCRIFRPRDEQIEVAITRIANKAEAVAVQDQDDIANNTGRTALLLQTEQGRWQLAVNHKYGFISGLPLKVVRNGGEKIPVRLGDILMSKRDFEIFDLRMPPMKSPQ